MNVSDKFANHPPSTKGVEANHAAIRLLCSEVEQELKHRVPESKERSIALIKLEELAFWANKGIALAQYDPLERHNPE